MLVREARARAEQWMSQVRGNVPGFRGALLRGSINDAPDGAAFAAGSDIDLAVIVDGDVPDGVPAGKFAFAGVILDVLYWPMSQLRPAERVLGDYRIGDSFRRPAVLWDDTGELRALAAELAREFPKRCWVRKRVEDARANCLRYVNSAGTVENEFDRVLVWLWAAGITTHIILAAALRNPTVRRRYAAAREVLAGHGRLDVHEALLELQGSGRLDRRTIQAHLDNVASVFDLTCAIGPAGVPFSSDISPLSRTLAIEGTQVLIDQGLGRESVFWILATYARCMKLLQHAGATTQLQRRRPGFERLLGDLGISSPDDLRQRTGDVSGSLPQVMAAADAIMASHPGIED